MGFPCVLCASVSLWFNLCETLALRFLAAGVAFRRRDAEDDVEVSAVLNGVRIGHPPEADGDQLAIEDAADAAVNAVARVAGMAGDEELGGQELAVAALDLEMNVRAAAGIRNRLDGAEAILALLIRSESAKALEVAVAAAAAVGAGVEVDAVAVDLPDLDDEVIHSRTVR